MTPTTRVARQELLDRLEVEIYGGSPGDRQELLDRLEAELWGGFPAELPRLEDPRSWLERLATTSCPPGCRWCDRKVRERARRGAKI